MSEPVVCRASAFLNSSGTTCLCPEGHTKQGNTCERPRPAVTPQDIIQVILGLIGPEGVGRYGGDRGGSGGTDKGGGSGGSPVIR